MVITYIEDKCKGKVVPGVVVKTQCQNRVRNLEEGGRAPAVAGSHCPRRRRIYTRAKFKHARIIIYYYIFA